MRKCPACWRGFFTRFFFYTLWHVTYIIERFDRRSDARVQPVIVLGEVFLRAAAAGATLRERRYDGEGAVRFTKGCRLALTILRREEHETSSRGRRSKLRLTIQLRSPLTDRPPTNRTPDGLPILRLPFCADGSSVPSIDHPVGLSLALSWSGSMPVPGVFSGSIRARTH
jgi:hypothetical protein